jgi:hypothetical protein
MDIDMADVKASLVSFVTVVVMAIIGITLAKWALTHWYVKGLSELVLAV